MMWIQMAVVAAALSMGAATPVLPPGEPPAARAAAPTSEETVEAHVSDGIRPGLETFKTGAIWGLFGAGFVGAWALVVTGLLSGLVVLLSTVGGALYGGGIGGFAGIYTNNIIGLLILAIFGLVGGAIGGFIGGVISAVLMVFWGTIAGAIAGSFIFGVLGAALQAGQQWLSRVPFAALVNGGDVAVPKKRPARAGPRSEEVPRKALPEDDEQDY